VDELSRVGLAPQLDRSSFNYPKGVASSEAPRYAGSGRVEVLQKVGTAGS
jgi:hypothetical protein